MIKLGFSTGILYKSQTTKEALKIIKDLGCFYVEVGLIKIRNWSELDEITKEDMEGFRYVSFHAPKFEYGNNEEGEKIINKIKNFSDNVRKLDLVVFHPDTIEDFSVLKSSGLPVGLENMDQRKNSYKHVEDFKKILSEFPDFSMVLDVNHVYVNDPSMKLAADFYRELGSRISEVHLSGYSGYNQIHEPLFETKQTAILRSIEDFNVPIIIEGLFTPENILKEKEYVLRNLA